MSDIRILFVCLGNICRSPLAEGMMRHRAAEEGLDVEVDSAGTGDWHIGAAPQAGSQTVAELGGFSIADQRARQVEPGDFDRFTHIIVMDEQNKRDLKRFAPDGGGSAEVHRLLGYSALKEKNVLDPYQQGDAAFRRMYAEVESGIEGLIAYLKREAG
ncbi:MAG: low molecular weight protein-tyrosine-phosphatase [Pacificimonas sp.]|jgi:protein-tyrosine phosphatase|nr:low molecular weight protein-tyrosine-phosphatase [Pacificimonas sp.]